MKTLLLSLFFSGIFTNAQFAFPDPKAPNPAEEIEENDELIMLISGNKKIKQSHIRLKAVGEINIEARTFDHNGNLLSSSDITEIPTSGNSEQPALKTRNDEYKTNVSDGKITSFEYFALDEPVRKGQIFYDTKNKISKIIDADKNHEYTYDKGRIIKKIKTFSGYQEHEAYQYDDTGKLTMVVFKSISPKGKIENQTKIIEYDKNGNILLDSFKDLSFPVEKRYSYENNRLTKYTVTLNNKKADEREYEYDGNGKIIKVIKTNYNIDTNTAFKPLIIKYKYKDGLLAERSTLIDGQEPAYIETFSYDGQNKVVNIMTRSENTVVANTNVVYSTNTITLAGDYSQSVYTLYE